MNLDFAIGCMRGGMWAFVTGAFVSIGFGVWSRQSKFLWLALVLELIAAPILAMKIDLEKARNDTSS